MRKSVFIGTWRQALILIGILLLAAFLAIFHLGFESLWGDEMNTWQRLTQPDVVAAVKNGVINSMWPLYHGGLYLFVKLAGDSEFSMRLPSALAQVVAVAAIFTIGRRLYSAHTGLAAAAMTAVSWSLVAYSQEARIYQVEVAAMAIGMLLWVRLLRALESGQPKVTPLALGYFAIACVLIYLHSFGFLILAMQGLTLLAVCLRLKRGVLLVVALYAGLAVASVPILLTLPEAFKVPLPGSPQPRGILEESVAHVMYAFGNDGILTGALAVIGLVAVGYHAIHRTATPVQAGTPRLSPDWIVAGWYVLPFLIFYVLSVTVKSVLVERYFLMVQPPVYLLAARAIERLPIRRLFQSFAAAAVTVVLLFNLVVANQYYSVFQKPPYRQIYRTILSESPTDQRSMIVGGGWTTLTASHYYIRRVMGIPPHIVLRSAYREEDIDRHLEKFTPEFMWYVTQPSAQPDNDISLDWLDSRFHLLKRETYPPDITVSLYEISQP